MKLKTKFVLGNLFILIFFLISSLLSYQFLLRNVLLTFEEKFVLNKVEQFINYLEVEKENLLGFTRDWAAWSESYLFLQGKNPKFPEVNLTVESWINNKLGILLYMDKKGNPLAGGFYDENFKRVIPIDKTWVYEHLNIFLKLYSEPDPRTGYVGLSLYKNLPCIVAIHSVTTSDFKANPIGFLITARLIDHKILELLKKFFGFHDIKLVGVFKERKELGEIFPREDFYEGKVFLKDFSQTSFISFSLQIFRIFPWEEHFFKFILFQIIFLLIFSFTLIFYFKEFVIERFLNLVKQVNELKNEKRKRIEFKGKDEIAIIAQELNQLYEKVKSQMKEIEEAKKIYEIIAEKANMLIALLDQNKRVIYFNPLAKKYLTPKILEEILSQYQMDKNSQFQICSFDEISLQVEVIPVRDYSEYYLVIGYDVTTFKEKIDQLFEISIRDFLTGIYNRRYIEEVLEKLQASVKRGENYAVLFIDLDDLKRINDVFGHWAGDEVLKRVTKAINEIIRKGDWVGRWGGDEFVVVLKSSLNEAKIVAERIIEVSKNLRFFFDEQEVRISVSIGIAPLREDRPIEEIIKVADQMAYEAKKSGKGSIKVAALL